MNKKDKKTTKISIMTLVHNNGDWSDRGTDTERRINLTIRKLGNSGSCYCLMPKELGVGNITLKRAILEFDPPVDLETLDSQEDHALGKASYMIKSDYGEKQKTEHIQHTSIKAVLLMRLLGLPDRGQSSDIYLYREMKEKLQDLGAKWYIHDFKWCEDNKESFSVNASVDRFFKNNRSESKMKEAGLTKEEIDDKEMLEAVMRKIIDEQLEPYRQNYGEKAQDQILEEWRALHRKATAKRKPKSKGRRSRRGITVVKAETLRKKPKKEDTPEEKEELREASKQLLENIKKKQEEVNE
jgi:hypothetical protein